MQVPNDFQQPRVNVQLCRTIAATNAYRVSELLNMPEPNIHSASCRPSRRPNVLFIDDEHGNRAAFKAAFRHDFNIFLASDMTAAWDLLARHSMDVVICDQVMPGQLGNEALREVSLRYPQVRRMLFSAHADLGSLVDALNQAGVCHYIQKPWTFEDVRTAIQKAHASLMVDEEQRALTRRLEESNRQLEFALRQRLLS